jgi:hypothetical protein
MSRRREGVRTRVNLGVPAVWRCFLTAGLATGVIVLAGLIACSKQPSPKKTLSDKTKAFDAVFGELPRLPVVAPGFASVAYFPSSLEPGKFRPVPIFSVERGKEEMLVIRAVVEGIGGEEEGPVLPLRKEISLPFPHGSKLVSLSYDGGLVKVTVGGHFRSDSLAAEQKETAAKALALTVSQFGKGKRVEVIDASGMAGFDTAVKEAEIVDVGPPRVLGLMAIQEEAGRPLAVLSVLFDRPVFIEDAAFYPSGGNEPYTGDVYSTGFGMTLELHPEPKTFFDSRKEYRIRLKVRDGKGRRTEEDRQWRPKVVSRH